MARRRAALNSRGSDPRLFTLEHGEQRAVAIGDQDEPVTIRFAEPATLRMTLRGRLPDGDGQLELWSQSDAGVADRHVKSGSHVASTQDFDFRPLQPGTYRVLWSEFDPNFAPGTWLGRLDLGWVRVRSGSRKASIQLPLFQRVVMHTSQTGSISIRSMDGASVTWSTLPWRGGEPWTTTSPPLSPGEYEARIGDVRRSLRVPGTMEIVLED